MAGKLGVGRGDMMTWYGYLQDLNLVRAENPVLKILRQD